MIIKFIIENLENLRYGLPLKSYREFKKFIRSMEYKDR